MKRFSCLALAAIALSTTSLASGLNPLLNSAAPKVDGASWADVSNYLVTHAVAYDATTEGALFFEAAFGLQSWTVVGGQAAAARPDGPAIGWPQVGMTIEFASLAEAETAAALILDVTFGNP
jgi:hypothetical protein